MEKVNKERREGKNLNLRGEVADGRERERHDAAVNSSRQWNCDSSV